MSLACTLSSSLYLLSFSSLKWCSASLSSPISSKCLASISSLCLYLPLFLLPSLGFTATEIVTASVVAAAVEQQQLCQQKQSNKSSSNEASAANHNKSSSSEAATTVHQQQLEQAQKQPPQQKQLSRSRNRSRSKASVPLMCKQYCVQAFNSDLYKFFGSPATSQLHNSLLSDRATAVKITSTLINTKISSCNYGYLKCASQFSPGVRRRVLCLWVYFNAI